MYRSIEKAAPGAANTESGKEQKSNISISPLKGKIKDIRIQEIILENFRGIQYFRLSPQGRNINIYGRNGAGKTTIADAWCWLLFGENSHGAPDSGVGKFDVQTRGTTGLDYSVSATITCSGESHTLKRVFREQFTRKRGSAEATKTGYTTSYYIDEVPCKSKKEYETFLDGILPDREIAKALTLPYVFPGTLKADTRRELLLKWFAPELDEDSILSRHPELAPLRKHKEYKSVEQYQQWAKEKRRAVNKELDAIPGRMDEAEKAKSSDIPQPGDETKYAQLQNMKAKLTAKISGIRNGENMILAFPPCTYLSNAGAKHLFKGGVLNQERYRKGLEAKEFLLKFLDADCPHICVENPVSSRIYEMPPHTQEVQPWMFGHPVQKKTRLWLKGLPSLEPTNIVDPKRGCHEAGTWFMKGGKDRQKNRAKTFPGLAKAIP